MSTRILCLNFIPSTEEEEKFSWAEAIVHPGTTLQSLWDLAMKYSWERPMQIERSPGEQCITWEILRSLWCEVFYVTEESYHVSEDDRCQQEKPMERFSEIIDPCQHDFQDGLCTLCLCPETPQDAQRSSNALDNFEGLKERWSDVVGRYVTREDALHLAWRINRRRQDTP